MDPRLSLSPLISSFPWTPSWKHTVVILAAAMALSTPSRAQSRSFSLQPRQPQSLSLTIPHNQVQVIHLHLDGGIIGVRETAGSNRPLWLVDLGRGGNLSYVISGNASGKAVLEITCFERERRAEVSVSTDPLTTPNEASAHLLQAEDLLASAELIRRHWPGAPSTTNPLRLYDHAFSLAADISPIGSL